MIRFVHCIKAKQGLSAKEFRDYIKSDTLSKILAQMMALTKSNSYKVSLTLQVGINSSLAEQRGGAEAFDAIIESWWESGRELLQVAESEEFKQLDSRMTEYQGQFVDFSRSSRFFVDD